jgi:quinol monooxygenase YgiN
MKGSVFYVVKSVIPPEGVDEFNEWYHRKHIPELVEMSGCVSARRFQAVQKEDEFVFMAVYEFVDQASFQKYQESEAKKYLVGDFQEKFGQKAKLKTSVWEQIYP